MGLPPIKPPSSRRDNPDYNNHTLPPPQNTPKSPAPKAYCKAWARGSGDGGGWVDKPTASMVGRVADALGLRVVGPLAGGLFGAVLVTDSNLERLVLKVLPQAELASVWAAGAAMATRLREDGYPAPRYVGTGTVGETVWSLQECLAGEVPRRLGSDHARQLVGLARRHDADSGLRRDSARRC